MVFSLFFQGRNEPFQKTARFHGGVSKERSHKTDPNQHRSVDPEKFHVGANGWKKYNNQATREEKSWARWERMRFATPFSNDPRGVAEKDVVVPARGSALQHVPSQTADPSARRPMPLATTTCCWRGAQRNSTIQRRSPGSNPMRSSTMPSSLGRGLGTEDGIPMW